MSWGHKLHVLDIHGEHIGTVKQKALTFLPKFELYVDGNLIGNISKEFTFFKPLYNVDCKGWSVKGNMLEWDYSIIDNSGNNVAVISKEIFNFTDTYSIEVANDNDALYALMVTLAIDAEKCSRN